MDKLTEEQMIEILSDKMDSLRCLSCSKYFPDPCEDCSFVEVFNDVVDFVSSLLQKEREAGKREAYQNCVDWTKQVQPYNQEAINAHSAAVSQMDWELKSQTVEKEEWQSELGKVELPERRKLISEFDKKKSEGTGGKE